MGLVCLVLRLVLAAVFAVAGAAKLADRPGSRQALEEFGLPRRYASVGSVLLPVLELMIVATLLFAPLVGTIGALALLIVFEIAIANAMVHDRTPDCHCFGQLHSEPAGRSTLVRNAVLIVVGGIVAVFGPGPSLQSWIGDRSAAELTALVVVVGAGVIVGWLFLARHSSERSRSGDAIARNAAEAPAGRPIGSTAPSFTLQDLDGNERTLDALCARGRPVALVFVQPDCASCESLLPALGDWQARLAASLTITVISEGSADDNRHLRDDHGIVDPLLQRHTEVYRAYKFRQGTPAAVVVAPDRRIASVAVSGTRAVEELIRLTLARPDFMAPSDAVS